MSADSLGMVIKPSAIFMSRFCEIIGVREEAGFSEETLVLCECRSSNIDAIGHIYEIGLRAWRLAPLFAMTEIVEKPLIA
jgi:hypothetical protein